MKKLMALLLAAVMVLSLTAAVAENASDAAAIQEKGVLVVGITDFAPMDYKDDNGNWVGIDAELATMFAESLGVDVEFIEIDWDNKILELNAGTVDCIWNGMTLTDEVLSSMECTDAYMSNAQVIVAPTEVLDTLPEELDSDDAALTGMTFAVEAGSAGEAVATDLGWNVTPVSSQANALMEVAAGTSDAAVIDELMAMAMVGEGTSYANLDYDYELNTESYGVGFRTGSDLADMATNFLAACYEDGTTEALIVKYLGE